MLVFSTEDQSKNEGTKNKQKRHIGKRMEYSSERITTSAIERFLFLVMAEK
jgi:hypothetical protein